MRFNPDTERAINIDDIAAQCRAAVLMSKQPKVELHNEVVRFVKWQPKVLVSA